MQNQKNHGLSEMEDQTVYHITLSDGTILGPFTKNGDCYVSDELIDISILEDNLAPVIISDGVYEDRHEHMGHPAVSEIDGKWYLSLWDLSAEELRYAKLRADIDYLAMSTDTDM